MKKRKGEDNTETEKRRDKERMTDLKISPPTDLKASPAKLR